MSSNKKTPYELAGYFERYTRNTIIKAVLLGLAGGAAFKYFYIMPKRKAYDEFYKNYDAEAVFEEMMLNNVFDSVKAP
ncbi:hypothetical protein FQR65_LT07312 [Abscondita terminalis]|nr:hypothetical protein FQR65_LT07312 [Abscondita terminalis]